MATSSTVLIDDRLLVARLVGTPIAFPKRARVATTTYWYYRACRAATLGGAGQLSGPFAALAPHKQAAAIEAMLYLPDDIMLPDPRSLVPAMVRIHRRQPHLNLLNLEATAAAVLFDARALLSPRAAQGVLPAALDAEDVLWETVEP